MIQGRQRFFAWVLVASMACQLLATGCGPAKDNDPKPEHKRERKEDRNSMPLLIINGLKLAIKVLKGRRKSVLAILLKDDTQLGLNTTLVGLPTD